jgi:transposase
MRRFRTAHPSLKEKDFRLYAYLTAGLSATTIAVLLGKEKSVVYNRISRLKKSINDEFRLP